MYDNEIGQFSAENSPLSCVYRAQMSPQTVAVTAAASNMFR